MSSNFTVLAEDSVDEGLTLFLARNEGVPRLGIYNKILNKKKYIYLSWIESDNRNLRIKTGRIAGKDYPIDVIKKSVKKLLSIVESDISVRALIWRGVQILGDLIHFPKNVRNETECMLVPDTKKNTLWFAYTPSNVPWRVRPCFITTEDEKKILNQYFQEGLPWEGIPVSDSTLPLTMRSLKVVKELQNINPSRWVYPLLPIAKAAVFGFSEWSPDSAHLFGDALWSLTQKDNTRSPEKLIEMYSYSSYLLDKLIVYFRLYPILQGVSIQYVDDADTVANSMNMKKKERFELSLSSRMFTVTRYNDENMYTAFGVVPQQRLPGEKDRYYRMNDESWNQCIESCSLGGQNDPYYSFESLIHALETNHWLNQLLCYINI